MITWQISQLERTADNGGVIVAHWSCSDTQDGYSGRVYSTASWQPDPSAEGFIPYDQLTEADVIGWVQAEVDKDATEAAVQAQIDALKNPVVLKGVPW